jgi:hypothetical protein
MTNDKVKRDEAARLAKALAKGEITDAKFDADMASLYGGNGNRPTTATQGEYNGFPMMYFAGNFKPFGLSVGKIGHIAEWLGVSADDVAKRVAAAPVEKAKPKKAAA